MRSRGILLRHSLAALVAVGSVLSTSVVAHGDGVSDQKHKVDQLATELDNLSNRIGTLDEEYGAAQDEKAVLDQDIVDSLAKIAQQEQTLGVLTNALSAIAVDNYVSGGSLELSPLFSNVEAYSEAQQKDSLSNVVLDNGSESTDRMQALADDLAKEQAVLSTKQQQVADLVTSLNSKLAEAQKLEGEYKQKLASATAELAVKIEQERQRRAEAAAKAEIARQQKVANDAAASNAAAAAAASKATAASASRGGGTAGGASAPAVAKAPAPRAAPSSDASPAPADTGGGSSGPPVSSKAGIAVNAAQSQLGVPYVFAAESPGVAFDCSGLTKYAWGQAGVSLPHQSASQYASTPHVPVSEAQPGDLIFYRSPIGHVAIYIGGGSLIHAPQTGDVVKTGSVKWASVVGVGRPG
jgi:peptidoglycan DL-endopeptidase CwlO